MLLKVAVEHDQLQLVVVTCFAFGSASACACSNCGRDLADSDEFSVYADPANGLSDPNIIRRNTLSRLAPS
jgi:hypothetical protein